MPNLEEWHLYASGACPSEDVAETVSGMTRLPLFDLPLLRIITLNGTPTNEMIDQLSRCLRAPALETLGLCIGRPAPHLRFPMFANAKKLINLSIDVKYFWVGPEPPIVHYNDSTIPLLLHSPNVTNLHLGVRSASPAAIEAIRFGAVPKLKTLRLHFATMEAYPEHILCTLEALVLRSRTPLSELVLDGYGQTMGYGRDVSFRDAGYQKRWVALGKVISVHSISSHRGFNDQS